MSQPETYIFEGRVYSRFVTSGFSVGELECLTEDGERFLPRAGDVVEVTTLIVVDNVNHEDPHKWVKAKLDDLPALPRAENTKTRSRVAESHNLQAYSRVTSYIPREKLQTQPVIPGLGEESEEATG